MEEKYSLFLRTLHWSMAVLLLGMVAFGWFIAEFLEDAADETKFFAIGLHKSIGVSLLILASIRVIAALVSNLPKLPEKMPKHEQLLAKATKLVLYALMFAIPLTGYAMSNLYGYGVQLFGIPLPTLFVEDKPTAKDIAELHELFAFSLLFVVGLHVAGALKHRIFENGENDVLPRMGFFRKKI